MPKVWLKDERCVWCKKRDSPPTTEDVFAKWIIKEYGAQKSTIYRVDTETGIKRKSRGNAGILTPTPCKNCNGGWMSVLENTVKPIISQCMRGESVVLSESDRLALARWTLKTAIMYEYAKGGPRFFNQTDRTNLYKHSVLPPYTRIWGARFISIAAMEGTIEPRNIQVNMRHINTTHKNGSVSFDGKSICITFVIEHFALQMFVLRDNQKFQSGGVNFTMPAFWRDAVVDIYSFPFVGNVSWPPSLLLNDVTLEDFMARWSNTERYGS